MISGFLIAASFAAREDMLQYVVARVLRIYPALVVFTLVLALIVGPLVTRLPMGQYFGSGEILRFLTMNTSLREVVFNLPGVFKSNHFPQAVNGTLWSLWVEVRLYVLLAVLGAFGGITNRLVGNLVLLGLAAWFLLSPANFPLIGGLEQHMRVASFFWVGTALYINRDQVPLDWKLAALLCVVAYLSAGRQEYVIVFGGLLAYLTLYIAFLPKLPLPRFVQDYSYGIYLYGWPIQQLIAQFFPDWGPLKMTILAVPLAVIAGAASWFLIEKPALRLRKKFLPEYERAGRDDLAIKTTSGGG